MGQRRNHKETVKYFEMNKSENMAYRICQTSLQDIAKVLRRKLLIVNTYIKKEKIFQSNNLALHLKELEK